jgi:hypothetical protein
VEVKEQFVLFENLFFPFLHGDGLLR